MSLRVWLPLTGDLHNQGLSEITVTNTGATVDNSGKIGKCYSFDGTNDYISGTYNATSNISFCCWMYFPTVPAGRHIFDARNASGVGYQPIYISTSYVQIGCSKSSYQNCSYSWKANTWYHICVTHDDNYGKLYVNGILVTTTSCKGVDCGECFFTLGSRYNQANYSNVKLNDVRIYDHCLSQKEIKEISKGLILHYPLTNEILNYSSPNLIQDYMLQTANWTYSILDWTTYEGERCMIVNPKRLYSKTSSGTLPLIPEITFKPNKRYLLTIKWRDDYRTDGKTTGFVIGFRHTDGTANTIKSSSYSGITTQWVTSTVASSSGKSVNFVRCSYVNSGYMYVAWIKIEELNNINVVEGYTNLTTWWNKENSISVTYDSETEMYKISDSSHTSSRWGIYKDVPLKPNTKYIFSVYGNKLEDGCACGYGFAQGNSSYPAANAISATTKTYYSKTITTTENATVGRIYMYLNPVSGGTNSAYFSEPFLEECVQDGSTPNIYQNNTLGINNNVVQDCSGYGYNGTLYSNGTLLTYLKDYSIRNGTCLYWGNQSDCSNYVLSPSFYLSGDQITMNLWVKSLQGIAGGANYHIAFSIMDDYYEFSISSGGSFRGGLRVNGTRYVENCANPSILDKKWHMITMTYDGATIRRYVDAIEYKSTSVSGSLRSGASTLRLGRFSSSTYYNKQIFESDARLYATALSQNDIEDLYYTSFSIDKNNNLYAYEVTEIE